jgi:DNA-binding response OmpR family regulator
LIVGDNRELRFGLVRLVRAHGYFALVSDSAEEALEAVQAFDRSIVAIISDVQLPRLSGPELVRAVRPRLPREPVLLVTTCADEEFDRLIAGTDASTSVLRKPFRLGDVREWLVQSVLGRTVD